MVKGTRAWLEELTGRGYTILRGLLSSGAVSELNSWATSLEEERGPRELEAEVGYPGAGAGAVRRQLQVWQRDRRLGETLGGSSLPTFLEEALGAPPRLVLAHHNCLMTKGPVGSSDTPWHRDLRYWSFERGELVTAWIPLGPERPSCGGLWVIPGSHRVELEPEDFDEAQALRLGRPSVRALVERAVPVELEAGDLLLFHCRLLHRASRNREERPKRSFVFSFRSPDDRPLPGSRSARGGDVPFPPP